MTEYLGLFRPEVLHHMKRSIIPIKFDVTDKRQCKRAVDIFNKVQNEIKRREGYFRHEKGIIGKLTLFVFKCRIDVNKEEV